MQRLTRFRRRLAGESGFAMPAVMIGMFLAGLFSLAALGGVVGDIPIARSDQDHKRAHEAAEAGLAWYQFQLGADPTYWTKCTDVPQPAPGVTAPVNQVWNGAGTDPRVWRNLPGGSEAQYTIELLPATGQTACDPTKPQTTLLQNNTLRIRSTGRVRGRKRSIVATFKRKSFLDYVYFTNLETLDPATYSDAGMRAWAQGTDTTQGQCEKYWRDGRGNSSYNGARCTEIQFMSGDAINGPFHTNDSILTSGSPVFGRTGDKVEMTGGAPTGWRSNGGGGTPVFKGPKTVPAASLDLPPDNGALKTLADPAYKFTGKTTLVFQGDKVLVTNAAVGTNIPLALPPPNGIIYVSNGACGKSYTPAQNYTDIPDGCGNAWVKGTYSKAVTVAAENDVIINDDLTHTGDGLLGLIANQYIRVYHPVTDPTAANPANASDTLGDVTIDAAILSLKHSFIVDNYSKGGASGNLNVFGAIAQNFRGPVGSTDTYGLHGYIKNYTYDDRLAYEEPPNFLDPVQTAWRMVRATEQQPAR
ncbi:MAG: hypothetical protein QOG11_1684 [Solirubrobacteraceae bacterium]|jgi:hypothetical protein|nr:hypothetical protein [Solirubrobacteraceae bacterium]